MKALHRLLVTTALLLATVISRATDIDARAQCELARSVTVPESHRQTAVQALQLGHCDSEDLYYGITGPVDYVAARHCAYEELSDFSYGFDGAGILMLIYANGDGIERNLALARRFSCALQVADAEIEARLRYFKEAEAQATSARLDICDHITSGTMSGVCAQHEERMKGAEREHSWRAITAAWSESERAALSELRRVSTKYFEAAAYDHGEEGSALGSFLEYHRDEEQKRLIETVRRLEKGELPAYSSADFRNADRQLNLTYAKIMNTEFEERATFGHLTTRVSQRAWLEYREAWAAFGAVRYPQVPADAWRTYLTLARETKLREGVLPLIQDYDGHRARTDNRGVERRFAQR
jgi:uncharacterized protein YecT (DUF1311 family)